MYVRPKLTFVSFFLFFFVHLPLSALLVQILIGHTMGLQKFLILARFGPFWLPFGPKRSKIKKNVADPSCDLSKFAREGHLANDENFTSIGVTN